MSVLEARRTTLADLEVLIQAHALRSVDETRKVHELAMATQAAKATKKVGKSYKSLYKNFKDFFDYEEAEDEAWGDQAPKLIQKQNESKNKLFDLLRKANDG